MRDAATDAWSDAYDELVCDAVRADHGLPPSPPTRALQRAVSRARARARAERLDQ